MVANQDGTNLNLFLSGTVRWSRVGDRSPAVLLALQGDNSHVVCGVSSCSGLELFRTHDGSITKDENTRFIADVVGAATRTAR
ncbi:hypothetical protein PybrP1_012617 [[Pythium] brassicae (nom. inval.)]|nr:hypothetical protein PybrP1_012617 [[Pythium] brassicae (nom. inval.)]